MLGISLDHARAFVAFADHGSFAAAGQALGKPHTSVVYALARLESETELKLLDRTGHRSTLTAAGERVLEGCKRLLATHDELGQLCAELRGGTEPRLRIVVDASLPIEKLVRIVARLSSLPAAPPMELETAVLAEVEERFDQLDADVCLSVLPLVRSGRPTLDLAPLTLRLVAHRDHALARARQRVPASELAKHVLLTVRGSDVRLGLPTTPIDAHGMVRFADFRAKRAALEAGLGYGWLPLEKLTKASGLVEVKWDGPSRHALPVRLVTRRAARLGPFGRAFRDAVVDAFGRA
jgi:DNA-binding transcriptional LysR family regulator